MACMIVRLVVSCVLRLCRVWSEFDFVCEAVVDDRVGFFFFFKEEEGIRDIVRYSGIGDVYKRKIR